MDSLTHIVIGACIGDLFLSEKIGKKAMLYGAIAASLPDIDFVASFWLNTTDDLLTHRGFTHSFLFGVVLIILLAFLFRYRHRLENVPIWTWLMFTGSEIASHLFLDSFNAYGIGWFEPFSHRRISFHIIFVADPFFAAWPAIAAGCLLFMKRNNLKRKRWAIFGLAMPALYLLYCMSNKFKIDNITQYSMNQQQIHYNRYFTSPTPFNNWLWYCVAETDLGFQIGYRSVFDKNKEIRFTYFPRKDYLLSPFRMQLDLQKLTRFSQGYYTADTSVQGVVFNDLRFGQMQGWQNPEAKFVFHFFLQHPEDNKLVVQRGRFANWDGESLRIFLRRIRGND